MSSSPIEDLGDEEEHRQEGAQEFLTCHCTKEYGIELYGIFVQYEIDLLLQ